MKYKFYDTCSLLLNVENLKDEKNFVVSSVSLSELEAIKNSNHKDYETKAKARKVLSYIANNTNCTIWIFKLSMLKPIIDKDLEITPDTKILATAIDYDYYHPDEVAFVTNDLSLFNIANLFFGSDSIERIQPPENEEYYGYRELILDNQDMEYFYSHQDKNIYDLYINEYLIIRNEENEIVDLRLWTGSEYRYVNSKPFESKWFGKIEPYKNDIYQKMAIDSLRNNQLTVFRGPAGSGKSLLGFTYLFYLLETNQIDKIYIFCNPVATRDSAKLGFYPGDKDAKLLDSQIGNFLISKFGDEIAVKQLIDEGKIILVPAADCRGMDIGTHAGIYITEAQNSTINLMKLMLQRAGESTKCVIEGDDKTQVDLDNYMGNNNGLKRLSEVYRGQDFYGEVRLKTCYRSKIAQIAEQM